MLYPQTNEYRLALKLDGIWSFAKDPSDAGLASGWAARPPREVCPMPVPAAFNEMTSDPVLRDYAGIVWYFRSFDAPPSGAGPRHFLRFGAAVYHARIFLNGEYVGGESLGKLPFEIEVTGRLKPAGNLLAVRIDTTLNWQTLPPGTVKNPVSTWSRLNVHGPAEAPRPEYHFDFLNYGGLLRSVWLLALPSVHLEAVRLRTLAEGDRAAGFAADLVLRDGAPVPPGTRLRLLDADGAEVASAAPGEELRPSRPQAWSPDDPYLYTLEIRVGGGDLYRLPAGLRTVRATPDALLLNGKPVYLRGCGLHEDFALLGHGHSDARLVKDLTLLKNMGANSFRTSHYPYDEAAYQLADRIGLLVIGETSATGLNAWFAYPVFDRAHGGPGLLDAHIRITERMILRDHVHPCVIAWSLANEPSCHEPEAEDYFRKLFAATRACDPQRLPLTVVQSSTPPVPAYDACARSRSAQFCDFIAFNRYFGWYQDSGHLEDIAPQLRSEAMCWREAFPGKPVMLSEFGADAVAGIHSDPPVMFSEEYQAETIRLFCETLDALPFMIGEHVWNLCDFMTKQGLNRVCGNRKGIHTRDRQPKLAAHYLKRRWQAAAGS